MDGVLVNNTQAHVKAFEIFCERYGVEDWQHKLQTAFGMGNDDIMRLILPEEIIREKGMKALGEEKEAIYREVYAPEIRPVRGLVELLEELRRRGIRCAVGSSGCRENVDFVLSNCGITDYFSCIVSGDRVTRCKPDPEIYLLAAEGLHLPSAECLVFEDARVGTAGPRNFLPAIEKGVVEGLARGAIAGYPVINTKVSVYDGSSHDVDSSEIAFKIASSRAFADGMSKAKPVLLEPIMTAKVIVPDQYMGDITGDMNHRRGRILGIGNEDGMQVITAEVPQAEMFRYSSELRSMTGGRGSFEMEFNRYDVVPGNIAQKVVAEAQKHKKEEQEE